MINTLDHLKGKWELNGDGEDHSPPREYTRETIVTVHCYT